MDGYGESALGAKGEVSSCPSHRYRAYGLHNFAEIRHLSRLSADQRFAMKVVARVLPFRVNDYVLEELIDWDKVPDDPMFRLVFPQSDMLAPDDFEALAALFRAGADEKRINTLVRGIRGRLNPHPAGQMDSNIPTFEGKQAVGIQHKYRETVLFFPSHGQTCHAYCSFCYRWPQFIGDPDLRIAAKKTSVIERYLAVNPQVTDLLITGGDPLAMRTRHLEQYLAPFLSDRLKHVRTVRIGTKALTYWPQRFVTDEDADDLLRLFDRLKRHGRRVALMVHITHWRELRSPMVRKAIRRILDTGAIIRSQAPILAGINDDPDVWARNWRDQVGLGINPYYMFIPRNTGAQRCFEIPLVKAWEIYHGAAAQVSGLGRTARGPLMSANPGKVEVMGVSELKGEKVFILRFIQGRNPEWVHRPFFARFDAQATWLEQLRPAFGEKRFFFEEKNTVNRGKSA